jgi:hypothetical protein
MSTLDHQLSTYEQQIVNSGVAISVSEVATVLLTPVYGRINFVFKKLDSEVETVLHSYN